MCCTTFVLILRVSLCSTATNYDADKELISKRRAKAKELAAIEEAQKKAAEKGDNLRSDFCCVVLLSLFSNAFIVSRTLGLCTFLWDMQFIVGVCLYTSAVSVC